MVNRVRVDGVGYNGYLRNYFPFDEKTRDVTYTCAHANERRGAARRGAISRRKKNDVSGEKGDN